MVRGDKTGSQCAVCAHEKRDDIEKAIIAGTASTHIAKSYDLHPKSVKGHRQNCIPETLAKARFSADEQRGQALIKSMQNCIDVAERMMNRYVEVAANRKKQVLETIPKVHRAKVEAAINEIINADVMALKALAQVRPSVSEMAKLIGLIEEGTTVNIHLAPDFQELRDALLKALRPHKEAMLDVADVMNSFAAERGAHDSRAARFH